MTPGETTERDPRPLQRIRQGKQPPSHPTPLPRKGLALRPSPRGGTGLPPPSCAPRFLPQRLQGQLRPHPSLEFHGSLSPRGHSSDRPSRASFIREVRKGDQPPLPGPDFALTQRPQRGRGVTSSVLPPGLGHWGDGGGSPARPRPPLCHRPERGGAGPPTALSLPGRAQTPHEGWRGWGGPSSGGSVLEF